MRERAANLVELDLGPRTDREILASRRAEMTQERLTSIDRSLLRAAEDHVVKPPALPAMGHDLQVGRLAHLSRLGLAEPLLTGRYRLDPDLEATLRAMGERGDIIRTMQREFSRLQLERAGADRMIYDPSAPGAQPLIGRVLMRGLADELEDRQYLLVDAIDGRTHYVPIGKGNGHDFGTVMADGEARDRAAGMIVAITPNTPVVREVDRTIATVAANNGGHYDAGAHQLHDPAASAAYIQAHVRRLEALRRGGAGAERSDDGSWTIAPNHLERVATFERRQLIDRPIEIEILSPVGVAELATAHAATWLDRALVDGDPPVLRSAGFGRDAENALAQRRQWLMEEGLAETVAGETRYRPDMMAILRRRELLRVAGELSGELSLPFSQAIEGERLDGTYRRRVDLLSGRFAVLERSRDFTLVPWKPVLERRIGQSVSGLMREDGVNWSFGRGRAGPSIS